MPWLRDEAFSQMNHLIFEFTNEHIGHPHRCDSVDYSELAYVDEEGPTRLDRKRGAGVWPRDWRPEMSFLLVCPQPQE